MIFWGFNADGWKPRLGIARHSKYAEECFFHGGGMRISIAIAASVAGQSRANKSMIEIMDVSHQRIIRILIAV